MSQIDQTEFTVKFKAIYQSESDFVCHLRAFTADTECDQMPVVGGWAVCLHVNISDLNGPIDWRMDNLITGPLIKKPPTAVVEQVEREVRWLVPQVLAHLQKVTETEPLYSYSLRRRGRDWIEVTQIVTLDDPDYAPLKAEIKYVLWAADEVGVYPYGDEERDLTVYFWPKDGDFFFQPLEQFNDAAERIIKDRIRDKLTDEHWAALQTAEKRMAESLIKNTERWRNRGRE